MDLRATPSGPLIGIAAIPGDKSCSHRALILGALAEGETRISGLLEAEDISATKHAVGAFGARGGCGVAVASFEGALSPSALTAVTT